MRLVLIADTHSFHKDLEVPDGDVLIHCGDYSNRGSFCDLCNFNAWLGKQPHKNKLVISGNHDIFASSVSKYTVQEFLPNALYLENEVAYINKVTFWGSPITPSYGNWAFMKNRGDAISEVWSTIPENTDVLITHGPPQGILDANINKELCGCYDLRRYIRDKKVRYHVFGHIHEQGGKVTEIDGTTFINCSVLNEWYELVNKPVVIDI